MNRSLLITLLVGIGVVGLSLSALVVLRRPSLTRNWDEDVRVLAGVEMDQGGKVRLTGIRDWRYTADAVISKVYFDQTFDPEAIEAVWLYEQILAPGGLVAHTFLVFDFGEDAGRGRYLGLSVETRREVGETYSIVRGLMRAFEVTHIWATEEDLVTRRVVHLDYPLRRYRLTIPPEYRARIFRKFARATADLAHSPRWYNTAGTNCTSALIRYVNEEQPGAIPFHYSYVFTGKVDGYLARLGYLELSSAEDITREWLADHPLR